MSENFILHGTIVYSRNPEHLAECPDSYVICKDGCSEGVFREIPEEYSGYPVEDFWDKLIIPGLADLSFFAPAYQLRGMNLDRKRADIRESCFREEEEKLADEIYAERSYDMPVDHLYIGPETRVLLHGNNRFSTLMKLMDLMDESGLISCVGPDSFSAEDTQSLVKWLNLCAERYDRTSPLISSPDFSKIPDKAVSDEIRNTIVRILTETGLPAFLNPNNVKAHQIPDIPGKSAAFFDSHYTDRELEEILKSGTYLICCPSDELQNLKAGSEGGLSCVRKFLKLGIPVGLGSGKTGCGTSMTKVMKDAMLVSGIYNRYTDPDEEPLNLEEVFYLATAGGGSFFGNCGSFEKGKQFDAVIYEDQITDTMEELSPRDRLERMIYLSDDRNVVGKYVFGDKLY